MDGRWGMLTIEGEAGDADRHDHGERDAQVVPVSRVVSRPDGADALCAGKEGAAEHKGPVPIRAKHRLAALNQALHASTPSHSSTTASHSKYPASTSFTSFMLCKIKGEEI